jgi:hypothetical protein
MRYREFIPEAKGLKYGTPGEIYQSQDGTQYFFKQWHSDFPPGPETQYPSSEDAKIAAEQVVGQNLPNNKVFWIGGNNPTNRMKSFVFAEFESQNGVAVKIGKFVTSKGPNNTIYDKEVRDIAGLTKYSASGQKNVWAVKGELSVKPGELGIATGNPISISDINLIVKKHKNGEMLSPAIVSAATQKEIIFPGGAPFRQALEDDFCEVIAPIAIIKNNPSLTGHVEEALSDIFNNEDISGASVKFPVGMNAPLVDSYIVSKSGKTLGVSSKGKQGAQATSTVLVKARDEAIKIHGPAILAAFKNASDILDIIENNTSIMGPIVLAEQFNLISDVESNKLKELLVNPTNPKRANPLAKSTEFTLTGDRDIDIKKVPPELGRLFNLVPNYQSGSFVPYTCLAGLAKLVAQKINTDPKINFAEAAKTILNHSAMVQAYSTVVADDNNAKVKQINIVYPPRFKGNTKIESNCYHGKGIETKLKIKLPST